MGLPHSAQAHGLASIHWPGASRTEQPMGGVIAVPGSSHPLISRTRSPISRSEWERL